MFTLDENLIEYCTDRQLEVLRAWEEHKSQREAAKALGCSHKVIAAVWHAVQKKAALHGYSPAHDMTKPVPHGYIVKGVSTYYDDDGKPRGQWVKSAVSQQAIVEALREAVDALKEDVPHSPLVSPPSLVIDELCNFLTFTDYHLGMYAWHEEGGADWDMAIAEELIIKTQAMMIEQSPAAHTAVINIQGDFLHTDGKLPLTPASKHVLDADTRFPKIRRAAIRIIRRMVNMALERHQSVKLIIAEGNHDEESAGWLADLFAVHYEEEPRVTVNDSVLPFYCLQWGECMIGVHHGHKVKNEQLPLLFAAQYPEVWGQTKRREIHCGHRHHRDEKEYNGVTVVQHPTLAARDAYAARGGWIADRAAWAITYHKTYGPVGRVMVSPEMVLPSA